MSRYKIKIEYDGANYHGWQIQKDVKTVQEQIENALSELNGNERTVLIGSGRTDSGVHAFAQVAHFDLDTDLDSDTLGRALNAKVDRDIVIYDCEETDDSFHSINDANRRHYLYKIYEGQTAINRHYMWQVHWDLDYNLLRECSEMIRGEHNFRGFCKVSDEADSKVCKIYKSVWKNDKNTLIYRICGNRFLHSMVRMLVGTMIEVARGKYKIEDFKSIFYQNETKRSPYSAPAKGLYLEKVEY